MQDFDFGAVVPERKKAYRKWPSEGSKTALIDGDMLPYIAGYCVEETALVTAQYKVASGECACIEETPEFLDYTDHLDWLVNDWVQAAGCDSMRLYLTESASNFRVGLAFTEEYKGKRPSEKPAFFYEGRQHLLDLHGGILSVGEEADDLMTMAKWDSLRELELEGVELGSQQHRAFDCIIPVSQDKDLRVSPGWHCDPVKRQMIWVTPLGELQPKYSKREVNKYEYWPTVNGKPVDPAAHPGPYDTFSRGKRRGEVKTKRVCVGTQPSEAIEKLTGTGLKFFYAQCLMGDGVDCYRGLPGCGPKRAYEIVDPCTSEEMLYAEVLKEYRRVLGETVMATNYRGGSLLLTAEQMLLEQGRLAFMQTRKGELWRGHEYCPRGDSEEWNA